MNIYIKAQELCRVLSQISSLPKEQQKNLIEYCKKYDDNFLDYLNDLSDIIIEVYK